MQIQIQNTDETALKKTKQKYHDGLIRLERENPSIRLKLPVFEVETNYQLLVVQN